MSPTARKNSRWHTTSTTALSCDGAPPRRAKRRRRASDVRRRGSARKCPSTARGSTSAVGRRAPSATAEAVPGLRRGPRSLNRARCGQGRPLFPPSTRRRANVIRNFDLEFESGNLITAFHLHGDALGIDFNMPLDRSHEFFSQHEEKVGKAAPGALIGDQNLNTITRYRRRSPAFEQAEKVHAALRPNSLPNKLCFSVGIVIGMSSPVRRRAASKYALADALAGLLNVMGEPRLEARSTSSLSGTIPKSGVDRISSTSSILSISPRAARAWSYRVMSRCFLTWSPRSAFTVLASRMPIMRSESRTDDTSGFVTTTASSA